MGDFTRLILAYYFCLVLLSIYQQYSLYSTGVLPSVAGSTLIILMAHHLGFTAFLSLFLYFAFNALETIRPRTGLYATAVFLAAVLLLESALTWYFITHFEMPQPGARALSEVFAPAGNIISLTTLLVVFVLFFYFLFRMSAPMQHWMGRVYPFTLALFSLFLATLLARSEPISESKTKYLLSEVYKSAFFVHEPLEYAVSGAGLDPLEEIYHKEEERIWKSADESRLPGSRFPGGDAFGRNDGFFRDPFTISRLPGYTYHKPDGKDLLRIQNTFYGRDFDRAFETARDLAHNSNYHRARELCNYILSEVPEYADAEILLGRILAWEGDYDAAARVLEQAVQKHPFYEDAYVALLDVYYWSGEFRQSAALQPTIETYFKESTALRDRMERARTMNEEVHAGMESGRTGELPHM